MFHSTSDPAAAYRKVGLEGQLESASPHKLVLMLFEGALLSISNAQYHMQSGNIADKGAAISRCIEIISSGLQASLDLESGGEIAGRLEALYEYMGQRLVHANLKNDQAALAEVSTLLGELKSAWEQIATDFSSSFTQHQVNMMDSMPNMSLQIGLYEQMADLSAQMAAAAQANDWDALIDLERQVATLRDTLMATDEADLSQLDISRKRALVQQILADDAEVRRHTEPWMEQVRRYLGAGVTQRRVENAYGAMR